MAQKSDENEILFGHLSKANKQWKTFSENDEILAIFSESHAYISSSWYNHENAPTWNYQAVHVYGRLHIIEGEHLKDHMTSLVDIYEKGLSNPVSIPTMSPGYYEKEIRGVVGFEIEITDIQAAYKLSQNRDTENYNRILDGLEEKGDPLSLQMKHLMKNRKPND